MVKLSKTSMGLIDEFDEAAQSHGREQEWGVGSSVKNAEDIHKLTKEALEKRILKLETKIRNQKRTINELRD